ncbi:MAG: type II toxin-antitoxin system VapC family toxin [Clostridiales Family XIII bacterium]|jgi:predicted nucleic acid-binding protein|nr:type II toxin-antitoxin system VapC family toxin [Clostridiales Family XIII bacterium]
MMEKYVLDSCALIAYLSNEDGAGVVKGLLDRTVSETGEIAISMNKINLLEVYYDIYRRFGEDAAENMVSKVQSSSIEIIHEISDHVFKMAGKLKSSRRISLADSIALAEAHSAGASIVTCDHHEFDDVEADGDISFLWIR